MQIPTLITKPATDWIKASLGLDLVLVKDKIIAGLTGATALSIGSIMALIYGFWNRGKQLSAEIASKLQWKTQATEAGTYATALAEEKEQTAGVLSKVTAEKTAISSELTNTKNQLTTTMTDLQKKQVEIDAMMKADAAKWQAALPSNQLYTNAKTGEKILTVEKVVVK